MGLIGRINKKVVFYLLGLIILALGFSCIVPCIVSFIYSETRVIYPFLLTFLLCAVLGISMIYFSKDYHLLISKRDGQIIIGLLWIIIPLLGSLPYMFFPDIFTISGAIFESFSGYTTTGSTIIDDLTKVPRGVLAYRSMTQWFGGLGFAVIIILFLSSKAGLMINVFNAEFSSVYKKKMYPHLSDVALRILIVYTSLTILGYLLLSFGSMSSFQAFCHSLTTVATGGFSTENGNVGVFNDNYTQWIIALLMFLSGTSYFVFVRFFKGDFKVLKDDQFIAYLKIIFISSIALFVYWCMYSSKTVWVSFRDAIFYTISIITTTGYDCQERYMGVFVSSALVYLMFIGGCSASSASGLKIVRVVTLLRYAKVSLKKIFHPDAIIPVRFNGKIVDKEEMKSIFGFFFLYMAVFLFGVFLLSCLGNEFSSSLTISIANLGNVGPVVGGYLKDFSYSSLNVPSQFVLILLMLMGRLEIFSFIALFSKSLWRKL